MSLTRGRELLIGARAGLLDPKHVRAMGSARWLYDWILWRVTSEQDGLGFVLGGSPVRCEEIAADLGVGLRTVYRWMNRLRGSYIRTRHVVHYGRHGLAIEVLRSKKFHVGQPRAISNISTVSTGNPATTGRHNAARFGRNNPAKSVNPYKEDRKPFTESYGKVNDGFLEDLPVGTKPPKANPPFQPIVENRKQKQKQIPRPGETRARNDSDEAQIPPAYAEPSAGTPRSAGVTENGRVGANEPERGILAEFGLVVRARAMPGGCAPGRREMLERQRNELLKRAARRCLPP